MISVFGGVRSGVFFPSRPQYEILGTGILGQIASFERRLRGAAQTPLALPYPFRTWPGSGTWAERDRREVRNFLYLGGTRPSYSWILAYAELRRKTHMGKHLFPSWHHFQILASYFVPTTLFLWSHLEACGGLLSYDCCVVVFRYQISQLNTFVRAFVVFEGGRFLPNDTMTPSVSVLILHPREIHLLLCGHRL